MTPFERLAQRTRGWRSYGRDRAIFCCDGHEDKRPSVSVRELPDGRVLLHCFAGCNVESVLGSIGLTLESLFPDSAPLHHRSGAPRRRALLTAAQALDMLAFESMLTLTAAFNLSNGYALAPGDLHRLALAGQRIQAVYDGVRT